MSDFLTTMYAPGYYKINYRALRLREMVRWYGLKRGIRNYLQTRSMSSSPGAWTPGLWATYECKREDLSEEFWHATKPHRKDFEQLGFTECRLVKTNSLNPLIRDRGGVSYLDATRRYFGQLIFVRIYSRSQRREINQIRISFTAAFESGSFSCTNAKKTFDSLEESEVLRLDSYDVNFIYQKFLQNVQPREETPREFPDLDSLRQWFDARQVKLFEQRVRRGLFVPMSPAEVAAAQAQLRAPSQATLRAPRQSLGSRWALWVVIIGCILLLEFLRDRVPHRLNQRPDTVEYAGQEFKMRKAYATYEDYKDDPDNLDTNELKRIEKTMTFFPVPKVFQNEREFGHFLFDLKFPGYGLGGIGENAITDDGSELEIETVEIPQVEKDRVIVVRKSGEEIKLIDDFVYSTAAGEIRHVKLEQQTLRYYDRDDHLIREKKL